MEWLMLFPIALLFFYGAIYKTELVFVSLAFLTPLSVNIEEYNDSFGLFIPTEPILFGFLLLIIALNLKKPFISNSIIRNPIVILLSIYVFWILLTSITSSSVVVSLKYFLSKLWYLIPMIILGAIYFKKIRNIKLFFWLFSLALSLVVIYTVFNHAQYGFDEKSGHWVMNPFFKDHTIYGATIAICLPFLIGVWVLEKQNLLLRAFAILIFLILLIGLVFSYSRAAWLSVFVGLILVLLTYFRIKFSYLIAVFIVLVSLVGYNWDNLVMELERNKKEHTAKNIEERFESATNVSTDASNLERINRWDCALSMFKERPIMGFGPGTYSFEYARFQDPENKTIISTNFGNLGNAHSEYLGALSETGLIGLLLFVLVVGYFFFKVISLYQNFPSEFKAQKVVLLVILFSISTYFSHAFLNNFMDSDKAAIPIWGMLGMVLSLDIYLSKILSTNPK